jgi:hypothetical protein
MERKNNKKQNASTHTGTKVGKENSARLTLRAASLGVPKHAIRSMAPTKAGTFVITTKLIRGAFADTSGLGSQQITLALSDIIQTDLLAAYQELFEEVRLLKVTCKVINSGAYQFGGLQYLYIDRNPADAIVTNVGVASTEPESVFGGFHDKLTLVWVPRDPLEREYQLIASYTALASFNWLAAATSSTDGFSGYLHFTVEAEWRGRNF